MACDAFNVKPPVMRKVVTRSDGSTYYEHADTPYEQSADPSYAGTSTQTETATSNSCGMSHYEYVNTQMSLQTSESGQVLQKVVSSASSEEAAAPYKPYKGLWLSGWAREVRKRAQTVECQERIIPHAIQQMMPHDVQQITNYPTASSTFGVHHYTSDQVTWTHDDCIAAKEQSHVQEHELGDSREPFPCSNFSAGPMSRHDVAEMLNNKK